MLQVSKCLIGLAVMVLQSCDVADNRRDLLCGNWESVEGKPDVLIYKEGETYKVTVFKRSGLRRKLKPEPENTLEELSTDSSGQSETIELDAPPVEYSLGVNDAAGAAALVGFLLQAAHILALFKIKVDRKSVV